MEENPSAIRDYLDGELREATIRLAFPGETIHVSPIGLIPKGGCRLLMEPASTTVSTLTCVLCHTFRSMRLSKRFGSADPGP